MIMSPKEFAEKYLNMRVYLYPAELTQAEEDKGGFDAPTGWQYVRCNNYRLGYSTQDEPLWRQVASHLDKLTTFVEVTVRNIWGGHEIALLTPRELRRHFHQPFVGKGSPEQCQIAIQLIYRFHKAQSSIQHFLDRDFIGLDCNGFVGNYIQRVLGGVDVDWRTADNNKDPGPTTLINDLLRIQGVQNQIQDMKSMRSSDIYLFGFCDPQGHIYDPSKADPTGFGHLMMTQPGTLMELPDGLQVGVAEATASGQRKLRYLDNYKIKSFSKTINGAVFQIERGNVADKMNVRIARLAI
jgi:hypothetical protein